MTWRPDVFSLSVPRAPLAHVGSPPWDGGANCTGTFLSGTNRLRRYLQRHFPIIHDTGGYACRPNTASPAELSVHGTGRAIDLMVRRIDGRADPRGDEIANWLLRHAQSMGLQLIIWDRVLWNNRNPNVVRDYTGPSPHEDHLHIELNVDGANERMPFFEQGLDQLSPEQLDAMVRGQDSSNGILVVSVGLALGTAAGVYWWRRRGGREQVLSWLSQHGYAR